VKPARCSKGLHRNRRPTKLPSGRGSPFQQHPLQIRGRLDDGLEVVLRLLVDGIGPADPGARLGQRVAGLLLCLAEQGGAAQLARADQAAGGIDDAA